MEIFTLFAATFMIGMRVHILWDNRRDVRPVDRHSGPEANLCC
jgi:hypothetical protein